MPQIFLCQNCGASFSRPPSARRQYCSLACKYAASRLDPVVVKEKARLRQKAYYLANRDRIQAVKHKYRTERKEAFLKVNRSYYHKHREIILARAREVRVANPEREIKRKQKWNKAHPEALVHQRNKRRALKNNSPRNDLTRQQWQDIQAAQNHCCAYCGKRCKGRLTQDHITPLSKGGSHTLHNVIGACKSCNSRKWTRDILSPVQPLLL